MKNKIYSNILQVLLCLFAFIIPFSTPDFPFMNIAPSLIALLLLIWLIEGDFSHKLRRLKDNKLLFASVLCIGLYFLYLVGLLYSKNLEFGLSDLLLKLPLLIFPVIIFTLNPDYWTKKKVETLLKLFVLGSLITLIISIVHSWIIYRGTSSLYYFFYGQASIFHHPSYASMYYCFSFVISIYLFHTQGYSLWEKVIAVIGMILFLVEIILLESRAGILTFGSVLIVYLFYLLFSQRKWLPYIFAGAICICAAFAGTYKLLPEELNRIQPTITYIKDHYILGNNLRDTYVRFLIWDASVKVGVQNLPFGVGTGDIKDELMKQYQKENYLEPYGNNLNAHCQYLQIFVTLGILGVILFILIVSACFWIGYKRRNILFILFGLIMGINFLVESILEKQAGVMFFVFFFVILYFVSQAQLLNKQQPDTATNTYNK
ncbi:MAG: O-antigen ligase family protein [Bacteroidales bacterium]|jgi:O-antigen ligase|nr:O-antigen ligase family protein [Bacteroidales bacterium]